MALKFLRKKTTKLKSFLREYSISLYLSPCPFIINMYGIAFETDEYYIFAQEYALAGDLFDIIPPQVRQEKRLGCRVEANRSKLGVGLQQRRNVSHDDFSRICRKSKVLSPEPSTKLILLYTLLLHWFKSECASIQRLCPSEGVVYLAHKDRLFLGSVHCKGRNRN